MGIHVNAMIRRINVSMCVFIYLKVEILKRSATYITYLERIAWLSNAVALKRQFVV